MQPENRGSFRSPETAGKSIHDVVHHVEVACGVVSGPWLLRNIENDSTCLAGNGLRRLAVLEWLDEDQLCVCRFHLADDLREVGRRRRDAGLRLELVDDRETKALCEIDEVLVVRHDSRAPIGRQLLLPVREFCVESRVESREIPPVSRSRLWIDLR